MLQEVIDLQDEKVSALVEAIHKKDIVTFKSPTGSGKTYMMADLMNRILSDREDIVFIVSTLSKGNLGQQNYDKFVFYQQLGDFPKLKPYIINTDLSGEEGLFIPTDYNVYILPRDLYKEGGLLKRGPMIHFLQEITPNFYGSGQNKQVYLIKDECHQATNNLDELAKVYFTKIINISATPKTNQKPDVEMTEEEAENAQLIKKVELVEEKVDISVAIKKLIEIKDTYFNLLGVNPCLIIQISNAAKAEDEIKKIFEVINRPDVPNLKWMTIMQKTQKGKESNVGSDTNDDCKRKGLPVSRWRDYVKDDTSTVDIVIFKMVISEGWDIPRACMLYQIRDTESDTLDEQVLGRVRRNPRIKDFETLSDEAKEMAMKAWVWGVRKKEHAKIRHARLFDEPTDITDNIKIKTTRLKPLTQKVDFDIEKYLDSKPKHATYGNIFELYRKVKNASSEIKEIYKDYITDIDRWFLFTENIDDITKQSTAYLCDYSQSMELTTDETGAVKEVSFPVESSYTDFDENYLNIADWVWKRKGVDSNKFSFDSQAEKDWADILRELAKDDIDDDNRVAMRVKVGKNNPNAGEQMLDGTVVPKKSNPTTKYLWGKNFLSQSEIKFEYCMGKIHVSYPDFVMKDSYGRIHLFEVKSVNGKNVNFDSEEYKEKMEALKQCYKQASILTGYNFYLPVQKEDVWHISLMTKGDESTLTLTEFKELIKKN